MRKVSDSPRHIHNFRKELSMEQKKILPFQKLRGKIIEVFGTNANYAEFLGLSMVSLSAKLNKKTDFTRKEILAWCSNLGIATRDIPTYFFED